MADTFDTLDRWDSEGNALDTTIKLYNFGRQIAKDIHAAAQDDISLTMLGNSTLFASEFAEENPQKVTWTNLKTVHVKGKLAYSVPGSVPFADWDDYDLVMEASVGIRFQWNGTSVRIVSVKAEMLRDLPAWSVHAEAFSSKAEKRIQSGHIPVSRLLVRIWFNFLNWPSSSPKAILRKSIILDGSGKATRYRGTWETRFKYQVN